MNLSELTATEYQLQDILPSPLISNQERVKRRSVLSSLPETQDVHKDDMVALEAKVQFDLLSVAAKHSMSLNDLQFFVGRLSERPIGRLSLDKFSI